MLAPKIALVISTSICLFGIDGSIQSIPISGNFHGSPIPRLGHGRLVSYGVDGVTVTAFKPDGTLAFSRVLNLPDATPNRIRDVAISSEGRVAAVAGAYDRSGQPVSVIAWFAPDGAQTHTVITAPYAPLKLCFSPDGYLWALGRNRNETVVRRYDPAGKLVQTSAPLANLPPADLPWFTPLAEGVSALLSPAGDWIELGPTLQVTSRTKAPLPTGLLLTGFAKARDGRAVIQAMTERKGETPRIILLTLEPASTEWKEMPVDEPFATSLLLGSDASGNLVFWDKRTQSVIWSPSL
jgi:hypothetical protein